MSDEKISLQEVIEQLMTRIAQLEFEIAVLKAALGEKQGSEVPKEEPKPESPNAGYM